MAKTVFSVLEDNKGIKCSVENYGDYIITIYPTFNVNATVSYDVRGLKSWGSVLTFNKEYTPSRTKEQTKLYKIFKVLYSRAYQSHGNNIEVYNLFMELLFKDVCNKDLELFAKYLDVGFDVYLLRDFSLKDISLMIKDVKEKGPKNKSINQILRIYRNKFDSEKITKMLDFIKSPFLKELALKQYNTAEELKRDITNIEKYYKFLVQDIKKERQTEKTIEEYRIKLSNKIQEITTTNPLFVNDYFDITLVTKAHSNYDIYRYLDYYKHIDELCSTLKVTRKTNPMTYVELKSYIKILEDEYSTLKHKIFVENQKQLNAEWDNEKYEIIIPHTYNDCVEIGNMFHNCFGGIEWRGYFATGYRYGACIIEKATKKPLICLDIDIKTKEIVQYLAPYNYTPKNTSPLYPDEMREEIRKVILKNILE